MAGYAPLKITGMSTGLVQSREEFILPDDAYPTLENAYVWRERILRKGGYELLGRLRRLFVATAGTAITLVGPSPNTFNLFTLLGITGQPNAEIQPGSIAEPIVIVINGQTLTDNAGLGTFTIAPAGDITAATINYATGDITISFTVGGGPFVPTITLGYFPGLPVMGLRQRQLNAINNEQLIAFDTVYAYEFGATGWQEFIPGTIWSGTDFNFFWSTNYWVGDSNLKIFWVTNFKSGAAGDPIRYTNGTTWIDFAPTIDAVATKLQQCLALLPFRSRLLAFNTWEGTTMANAVQMRQRIRWAAIGTPFSDVSAIVSTVNANAWRDDIRGQGGFLDIPTSENIVSVGFVRDNLVIYCESSTWQLRYTGRSIAPFQIEKVNTELGAEGTFSVVQFDTSLVGIGDKGVIECDSFKSDRIDIKIPDLVFEFHNVENGPIRVHGIRDFQNKLAYWTYPFQNEESGLTVIYPNRRLLYNYENDSWAIFTDSLTTLGTFQEQVGRTWENTPKPWQVCAFPWLDRPALFPSIVGGNQQGFVLYLDELTTNDISLSIHGITGNTTTATLINSPNHNLDSGQVIEISNIPTGTPFATSLNGGVFGVDVVDADNFLLYLYDSVTLGFTKPQLDDPAVYVGGGYISIRDNFSITSKKFNFLDEGQQIQLGYADVLLQGTEDGNITMNVYMNYNEEDPINTLDENEISGSNPPAPDAFFNSVIPTNPSALETIPGSSKNWQRVFCPVRGQFLTIEYTFSNEQMSNNNQQTDVQIDAQILWIRKAGRLF